MDPVWWASAQLDSCFRATLRTASLNARKQLAHFLRTIVENPLDVPLHPKAVRERSEETERQRIADAVAHGGAAILGLEGMFVIPKGVWARKRPVDEPVRRTPFRNFCGPRDGEEVPAQTVADQGT
jgi:hypothetical protein